MSTDPDTIDLSGLIDMHMHTAPDVRPRLLDDVEAAQQAAAAGMRAIVLKSHVTLTADRATLAQKAEPGVRVFGGVALNYEVGGLNPEAVNAALLMGGRVIWMPTFSANNHLHAHGGPPGVRVAAGSYLIPAVGDILDLIKQHNAILATGHLAVAETMLLVQAARAAGLKRIVVTHPELPMIAMPAAVQEELSEAGVFFERCFCSTTPGGGNVPLASILADIKRVGPSSTIMATDFGQAHNPPPVAGFRSYIAAVIDAGFSWAEVRRMCRDNPACLLDLA
jgi:hypothetical protein